MLRGWWTGPSAASLTSPTEVLAPSSPRARFNPCSSTVRKRVLGHAAGEDGPRRVGEMQKGSIGILGVPYPHVIRAGDFDTVLRTAGRTLEPFKRYCFRAHWRDPPCCGKAKRTAWSAWVSGTEPAGRSRWWAVYSSRIHHGGRRKVSIRQPFNPLGGPGCERRAWRAATTGGTRTSVPVGGCRLPTCHRPSWQVGWADGRMARGSDSARDPSKRHLAHRNASSILEE